MEQQCWSSRQCSTLRAHAGGARLPPGAEEEARRTTAAAPRSPAHQGLGGYSALVINFSDRDARGELLSRPQLNGPREDREKLSA
ncbi:hypothetical protein NDU88_001047 [Pleurodeles waltl]|uniref:Uncharacterized protein n=1 Tax=Pleurodeles waltl TaxID=8319 RepID=A0AAV7MIM8_PLEWA|nr:hypothetical protein NDU88_001047 [Pleurodeles waltl]